MFFSAIIPDSITKDGVSKKRDIRKGGISKSTSALSSFLSANNYPPLTNEQIQELKESTESIVAGADKVLKAMEKWQSCPEYIEPISQKP